MEKDAETRHLDALRRFRAALPAVFGIVGTLFVIAGAGDLRDFCCELPAGWTALWLLTTLAAITLGLFLLVAPSWRPIPLAARRGVAMAYLLAGFINLLSFSIYVQVASNAPSFFCVPLVGGLAILVVYAVVYLRADRKKEETFP
jgi:hypothetical protein